MGWWQCEKCDGWWRTTGRVGWEESEFEAECNFENDRWVEICQKCRGHLWHPETRPFEEPHSPTGTYTEYGHRWIFVGQTQDPPLVYQCQIPRTVRVRMITTRPDYGDEEDIIMDSTDGEGRPLQIGENPNFGTDEIPPPYRRRNMTMEMDHPLTIPHKMKHTNNNNMTMNIPRINMNADIIGKSRNQVPEPWWWPRPPGQWNLGDLAMGKWSVAYSPIYTC